MIFKVEGFTGINNVDDERRVTKVTFTKDGDALLSGDLKSCSNYRLYKDGLAKVRNGMTKKVTPTAGRSWWTDLTCTIGLYVDGVNLVLVASDYTTSNIYTTLTSGLDMRFAEHKTQDVSVAQDRLIFMSNGAERLKYDGIAVSAWGDTTNLASEFEYPQLTYRAPPLGNIIISHYARMYVAHGRFLLYSESTEPEKFRMANNIPCAENITALSRDLGHLYAHTYNSTKVLIGRDPSDFAEIEYSIGAIKQRVICPHEFPVPYPVFMTRRGWAKATNGVIEYIDEDKFRLDLPNTGIAYTGYDPINKEVLCSIRQ